jgi:hypothetical protein
MMNDSLGIIECCYTQHWHNLIFFEFMFVPHNFWNLSIVNETTKTQFVTVLSIDENKKALA